MGGGPPGHLDPPRNEAAEVVTVDAAEMQTALVLEESEQASDAEAAVQASDEEHGKAQDEVLEQAPDPEEIRQMLNAQTFQ